MVEINYFISLANEGAQSLAKTIPLVTIANFSLPLGDVAEERGTMDMEASSLPNVIDDLKIFFWRAL